MSKRKPAAAAQPAGSAEKPIERTVACPSCRKPALYSPRNPWRPFCNERCRNVDLGAWASEQFRLPADRPLDASPDDDGWVTGH
jgi:hypothetical protein